MDGSQRSCRTTGRIKTPSRRSAVYAITARTEVLYVLALVAAPCVRASRESFSCSWRRLRLAKCTTLNAWERSRC